ncbi:hypothetical protein C1Y63_11525 [Corynebacterium sp. 13CS0277]|uniref:hypothetical protein n=1 Tax=Corynebacterium sp. 13CS0277 TaxID=2071994 RepID=UPI000D0287E1|nr:hypothetical protein [Corynebacterium sp. 13CS0277]PRQ10426.1 hypothetical protein C1Y63_11525 [Corynebacterium sp. 13CS0277]
MLKRATALTLTAMMLLAPQASAGSADEIFGSSESTLFHIASLMEGLIEVGLYPLLWVLWKLVGDFSIFPH